MQRIGLRLPNDIQILMGENPFNQSQFSATTPPVVREFLDSPGKEEALRLIQHFADNRDPESIAGLAIGLADSGTSLQPPGSTADVASTGGPSSLSTLLCPLFLVCLGFVVPKLGVQGRPAGGIDVMAQIPGFDINPSPDKIIKILDDCGYAHFLAEASYAPLDQDLFRFRQEIGQQSVPSLVIASILAKKIAVGVNTAGLEIRVFPGGNFGITIEEAKGNAELFNLVARILGIRSTCFITDCSVPYQPYIGRGEALIAIHDLLYGKPSEWLLEHAHQCLRFAAELADDSKATDSLQTMLPEARAVFEKHLASHGTTPKKFIERVDEVQNQPKTSLVSVRDGFPSYDLTKIRNWIVDAQLAFGNKRFPDSVGLTLLKRPEEFVVSGGTLIEVRSPKTMNPLVGTEDLCLLTPEPGISFQTVTI